MSSRALRKLRGEDELAKLAKFEQQQHEHQHVQAVEHSEQSSGTDNEKSKRKTESSQDQVKLNDSKSVTSGKSRMRNENKFAINPFSLLDEEQPDTAEHEDDTKAPVEDELKAEGGAIRKNKKKKKKKRKEEKAKTKAQEDDIEATIREVNEMFNDRTTQSSNEIVEPDHFNLHLKALLTVEHKFLNAENELKRIFGSRVVQANVNQNRRRNRGRTVQKSTWLTYPKDTWPHLGKTGLTMNLLETRQSQQYFAFDHNPAYQQVQFQFLDAVESLNPQNIMAVLNMYPYHIDSLIQLSEVCRIGEDMQMATELIERALFVFEINFHPLFSLTQGNCRLDYRRPENRAFYIAIFRHLLFVGQKGCNRTALEFCKLLLSLDPDGDPMAVMLMIDFYSLRAEEYSFLIRMYQDWEGHRNLSQLPNFAFSVALAMYLSCQEKKTSFEQADDMLQKALMMFPGVLIPLLDKCSVAPENDVESHAFFNTATRLKQPVALQQLEALYVGRCHSCWKVPEVISWLIDNVHKVINRVESSESLLQENQKKNSSRYHGTPRNILRHIIMSEIKDATTALPPEHANTPVLSYDPLPPVDSIVMYTRPPRPTRAQQETSAISNFFRSLLPNYNPQELAEEHLGAAGGQPANVREGVNLLMNAMRELLQNIRPVDPPVENLDNPDPDNEEPGEWD